MNYKIAQFILSPSQRSQSTLEIYVAQPDADKEALAGKLFALIEIESTKATSLKIINFLINTLNHNYYQNEKLILRERVSTIKIEHIFESALAKTNKKLSEFLQTEKIKLNLDIFNLTIGVVYNDSLHFANLGKNKALLIYKGKAEETAKYKLADISEQTGGAEAKKKTSAIKLFSNVISGALPRGGYFIFASETFGEYLSSKQIINIVTTLPPASAAEQIKNTLGKINAYVPFLGIIIKNTTGLEAQEVKLKEPIVSTKASIDNLLVTEEKTEKLLTPSGLVNAKKWSSLFNGLTGRLAQKQSEKISGSAFLLKDKIFTKKKTAWLSGKKIFNSLKNSIIYLIGLFVYIFKIITDRKTLSDSFNNLAAKITNLRLALKSGGLKFVVWYKNLNKTNKALFSVFIICLLGFALSLGWQNINNQNLEKQAAINNLAITIEKKQNQIDASLLYNNEEGASKILLEVKELLKQLPQNNQGQKNQFRALTEKNQTQIEKISHVIRVSPTELANFANLNSKAKPQNIVLAKGKIYAADIAQSAIYNIDLGNKLITTINLTPGSANRLDFPSLDKNNNINYFNLNNVAVLDIKSEKISNLNISYSGSLGKIIDLKQYNSKFYLADMTNGQIYRFTQSSGKLASSAPWLNSKEDLSNVVSMDIDGNIYLLKNTGEILKYSKGKKQDFAMAAIEPAISQATKIIVSPEKNYIFEPLNKRLIVVDKTGKLICQYTSDKLNNLKDFQVDEKNKKIYFLNDSTVYSIDAIK